MCPKAPADIGLHLTDEELVMFMERMTHGAPVPSNVITELNPYDFLPWYLPENIWYFFNWEEPKATGTGFWKAKGEASNIFTNSPITGWKITLEFFRAPHDKTEWMMHEYRITQNVVYENRKENDSSSLCRVFNGGQSSNHEIQHNPTGADGKYDRVQNGVENKHSGQSSRSMPQVINGASENGLLAVHERHLLAERPDVPIEDQREIYDGGDFLELLDLANPEWSSCSSQNSSCLSMSSDEGFDSLALLRDLETENNQDTQQNHADCKFSVAASLKLNQVVMRPASSGPLPGIDKSKLPREETINPNPSLNNKASKREKVSYVNEYQSSSSQNAVASSSGHRAAMNGERKAGGGRLTKFQKKYCCFMPF